MCLKCESGSSRFQPGEGPSRGLLSDYEPFDGTFWSTSDHGEDGEYEEAVHDGEASRQVVQGFPSPGSQTEDNRQM